MVIEKEFDNSADDLETINMWAELSDVSNATRTPDSTSETPTIGRSDVAKIRKDAEDAILSEELNRKIVKSSENGDIRFRIANDNQAIFVSNAAKAVEGIKMEKATPEQWLKMIVKNGGLKAGEDKQGRKVFYFLSETPSGTYNLMEIYANKKGNLTAKTYYKTKKGATQRVMELESLLSTSETYSGATLSGAKIPILFDIVNQGKQHLGKRKNGRFKTSQKNTFIMRDLKMSFGI